MKTIPLTRGYETIVDDEDYDELSRYLWFAAENWTGQVYARRSVRGGGVYMHRQLLGLGKTDKSIEVDHRNHNTLDNRRSNLRTATRLQNAQNRSGASSNSALGVRGVRLRKDTGKYEANHAYGGVSRYLGCFSTLEEAAKVVAAERRRVMGDYSGED
jgi:hypothetical protein